MAHDTPIPGFGTTNTINLRLWSSESTHEFDLSSFNEGNYYQAISKRQFSETISSVREVIFVDVPSVEGNEQLLFCEAKENAPLVHFLWLHKIKVVH